MAVRVSAIVSTYNAERFIRGAMEDLTRQTLFRRGEMEIIVVDSGSTENEGAVVREYEGGNVRYVRTEERETIYGAWNRGVELATGDYLTNANTDDRHRPDALEVLASALDERDVGVVYADAAITTVPNEPFDSGGNRYFVWPEFSLRQLLVQSIFGPQPMWRRSLHDRIGFFDPTYEIAGDHEFFIRAARAQGAYHLRHRLGLYYDGGIESRNLRRAKEETGRLLSRYRRNIPVEEIYPALRLFPEPEEARAVALWDFAHCIAAGPHKDLALSRQLGGEALAVLARTRWRTWARTFRGRLLLPLRERGRRRWGLGRDSGRWHPVLAELPPIAGQIVFSRE